MQAFFRDPELKGTGYPVIGKIDEVFAKADAVNVDTSGWLVNAPIGERILGFCLQNATMTHTNTTVALVAPLYVPSMGQTMVYSSDVDCIQTDIGAYADFSDVTSGAHIVDLRAGASGQLFVLGYNPFRNATDSEVVVEVAEPQILAFAQVV
jgi:hypothetical protein